MIENGVRFCRGLDLCNFKTIANNYPNTEFGKLVRGKCDNLYDYQEKILTLSSEDDSAV